MNVKVRMRPNEMPAGKNQEYIAQTVFDTVKSPLLQIFLNWFAFCREVRDAHGFYYEVLLLLLFDS